uniref:Uncharacterized protein n=1 Tax=Lactuca sativa TaxID=4236 RepID=A0A9R1UKY8_LACSA|nr:hypothetical protein LSAT_V11C800419730 [Lactuca sativa]
MIWMRQKHLKSGFLKLRKAILVALMMVKLKLNFQKTLLFALHMSIFIQLYPPFIQHLKTILMIHHIFKIKLFWYLQMNNLMLPMTTF